MLYPMAGVYIHIPYCVQRCTYCDFVTFERSRLPGIDKYIELLAQEIQQKFHLIPFRECETLYFGGGTPSLLSIEQLSQIVDLLKQKGFHWKKNAEWTIEINPGTMALNSLNSYKQIGFNRFSVGAQTFQKDYLKRCGREHSVQDTHNLLSKMTELDLNFSSDLLFALPHQKLEECVSDCKKMLSYKPKHISTYCLSVPEGHVMSYNRPLDEVQIEMFQSLDQLLLEQNFFRYEISNYAQKGWESLHNQLYWNDRPYWGLGLSAHSYFPEEGQWGLRHQGATSWKAYSKEVEEPVLSWKCLPTNRLEWLSLVDRLNDFCYMSLRRKKGLNLDDVEKHFGSSLKKVLLERLRLQEKFLDTQGPWVTLNFKGLLLSNQVFLDLFFVRSDVRDLKEVPSFF